MGLEQLLVRYGVAAVFVGAAIEGDFVLILSGVVAHLGYFPLAVAIGAGALGSLAGDCVWYAFGRLQGPRFRAGRLYRRVAPRIERLTGRLGAAQLLVTRFVYGTKSASMLFWGLHGLSFPRFLLYDAVGCLLGAGLFVGLGYLVSGSAAALLGRVRRVELWLVGALIVGIVLVALIDRLAKRELHVDEAGSDAG